MHNLHVKNTVRYYLLLVIALVFLFFSGNFGLIDVQKTAIVMAVGIDREGEDFIVTSQIAVPEASKQGNASQTVQLVSRGKTVANALEEINGKTGWYPKLAFCRLIILGEKTTETDVFDSLDFFLVNEYISDNCLIATCEGTAQDLLNVTALIDPSGSVAMQKVLSPHAERVGAVLPTTLREFSIGYFSDSKSGYMPLLKTQPQQEKQGEEKQNNASQGQGGAQNSSQNSQNQGGQAEKSGQEKPVFSANETALFVAGKRVGVLTPEETFAVNATLFELKLASYTVESDKGACTLIVRNNQRKEKLVVKSDIPAYKIKLTLTAGFADASFSRPLQETKDAGAIPSGVFPQAEKLLASQVKDAFEKCRAVDCDIFGVKERIQKYNAKAYKRLKNTALSSAVLDISVTFQGIR